jgi:hypothetical protein
MKISELIERLGEIQGTHGDLEVKIEASDWEYGACDPEKIEVTTKNESWLRPWPFEVPPYCLITSKA